MIFQKYTSTPSSTTPIPSAPMSRSSLQRRCACGGTPGPTGECEECKRKRLGLQAKLAINQPGDRFEQEANRAAKSLLAGEVPVRLSAVGGDFQPNEKSNKGAPESVQQVLQSAGQPLDAITQASMSQYFRYDFGRVRVHADKPASESARAVNAHAYTVGEHLVFDAGRYSPHTHAGRELIAHELAHVVQQSYSHSPGARLQRQQSAGWHPTFAGCSPVQDRRLDFQLTFARTRVEQTISDLEDFLSKPQSRVEIMTDVEYGLQRDFGTREPAYVRRIIAGFGKILTHLQKGSHNWRCADNAGCQKICGEVPFACAAPGSPVTFCPPHFQEGDRYGTIILIHETGHQAGFAFHTYDPIAARTKMQSKDIAITSSDSFASLVDDLTLGGPSIPGGYSLEEKVESARAEVKASGHP